jgi:hypothetical protein
MNVDTIMFKLDDPPGEDPLQRRDNVRTRSLRLMLLIGLALLGSSQATANRPEHIPAPCPPGCFAE